MKNVGYVLISYLSLMSLSFLDNGRGASYPEILNYFKIDGALGSLIFSLASISGLFVYFSSKFWLTRLGLVLGTRIFIFLQLLGSLGFSLAAQINSFNILLFSAAIAGIGFSGAAITMNIMVSEGTHAKNRRRFLSGLHAVYGMSSFIAPLLFNLFISHHFPWSKYFEMVALIYLVVLIYSFFIKDQHIEAIKDSYKQTNIKFKEKILIGICIGMYVASEILVSSRLTLYLTSVGFSLEYANQMMSLFFLFLLIGRSSFALFHFDFKNQTLLTFSLIITLLFFILGTNFHPFFLALCGLGMSYFFPVSVELLNESYKESSQVLISSTFAVSGIIQVLMHNGFGVLSTYVGVSMAMNLFYAFNLISLGLLVSRRKWMTLH